MLTATTRSDGDHANASGYRTESSHSPAGDIKEPLKNSPIHRLSV